MVTFIRDDMLRVLFMMTCRAMMLAFGYGFMIVKYKQVDFLDTCVVKSSTVK